MKTESRKTYKQILPYNPNIKVIDQFGVLPLSILEFDKQSKKNWSHAYITQLETEKRRSGGVQYLQNLGFSEFHAGLCEFIVRYWSVKGAHIVDPFMGRATRAIVSTELNRTYEGYEISPETYNRVNDKCNELNLSPTLYLSNGCQLSNTPDNSADLIMTCPPYWNIEEYEDVPNQLSRLESYNDFMKNIDMCIKNIYRVMKPGAFCCWVCADFRGWSGEGVFYPFHVDSMNSFTSHGLKFHDICVIQNQSPFAALQMVKVAAKRYTSKIHEYLLVYRKPGEYILPKKYEEETIGNINANNFFE